MSVSCGFYNAQDHDRRYEAIQMSSLFDGIIRDGVFMSIGEYFFVRENEGMIVNVAPGRCWFNHTWTLNDAILPIEVPQSEVILDRIDAVVVEVNAEREVRDNTIKIIKGTPSSNPERPALTHTNTVNQYAFAYISVVAGATSIRQADITNVVGTEETPFITGILETISIDNLLSQWRDEWEVYKELTEADISSWEQTTKSGTETWIDSFEDDMDDWKVGAEADFNDWLDHLVDDLSPTAAAGLAVAIEELRSMIGEAGHVIVNGAGTELTHRNGLQFNCGVVDDAQNDKTIITPIPVNPTDTTGLTCWIVDDEVTPPEPEPEPEPEP